MASGRVHDIINYSTLTTMVGVYALLHTNFDFYLSSKNIIGFSISYLIGTLWITPDLDLSEHRFGARVKKRWGKLGWLWKPYGKMFKHRGISHTWILGPMTRLIYLFALMLIIGYPMLWGLAYIGIYITLPEKIIGGDQLSLAIILGYYFSQWLHLVADGIPINYDFTVWQK